jgi:hypothetical protein
VISFACGVGIVCMMREEESAGAFIHQVSDVLSSLSKYTLLGFFHTNHECKVHCLSEGRKVRNFGWRRAWTLCRVVKRNISSDV